MGKEDAFDKRFKSFFNVFVPKLKPNYLRPCCFLNVANGNGSAMIRFESPEALAKFLRDLANRITTIDWIDSWNCIEDISANMITSGQVFLDEDFVDIDLFKEKYIEEPILQTEEPYVAIKKQV